MTPTTSGDLERDFTFVTSPGRTFALNRENGVISGITDGLEAVKQAIYFTLNVERYEYLIYSWNYGVELRDLIGMPVSYCMAELERRIRGALLQDDRINGVGNFSFETEGRKLHVSFDVHTNLGTVTADKEVEV